MVRSDVLIIGSGIAGLSVAIKVAERFPKRQVLVITKQESAESNTRYAQGGIAVVSDFKNDSFEDHIADTLEAGDGLCDPVVVSHVVHMAPERVRELMEIGAEFDRLPSGELMLGREGGHRANRIIHAHDITGLNVSTALLEKVKTLPNVTLLSHHIAVDLITANQRGKEGTTTCQGAYVLDLEKQKIEHYAACVTVMATGGVGQLYRTTTNPLIATGDGIAIAFRAGAKVAHMEFIQFHPTALYDPESNPTFLISEAVRGQGAYLRNSAGNRFMFRYHPDGDLACRDVVSRAIGSETVAGAVPYVFLDCTHLAQDELLGHFPNIYQRCLDKGIDMVKDYIPVAPAAHYLCGGINVDLDSRTSIENLYACGECSNTGLHGANRLASNSLLEATVFAHDCFLHVEKILVDRVSPEVDERKIPLSPSPEDLSMLSEMKSSLQTLMTNYAGIVRNTKGMEYALDELVLLEKRLKRNSDAYTLSPAWYELRNMLTCAKLILKQSLERKENRGGFFNKDLEVTETVG